VQAATINSLINSLTESKSARKPPEGLTPPDL
jgi:hypothetical protein